MMIHISSNETSSSLTEVLPGDVQPNAVDVLVDSIFSMATTTRQLNTFVLGADNSKKHRQTTPIEPRNGWFELDPGVYEIIMKNKVSLAEGEAGWVITRSTLNRNGVFITSGLYDSGYSGVIAGALHVTGGPIAIERGARVGQFLLFKAQTLKLYDGSYGDQSEHDKKYDTK